MLSLQLFYLKNFFTNFKLLLLYGGKSIVKLTLLLFFNILLLWENVL